MTSQSELDTQHKRVKWITSGLNSDDLTEWEQGFVESVEEQSDSGKVLTKKQMDKLEKIYKEKGR
jgi:hypothetical protein